MRKRIIAILIIIIFTMSAGIAIIFAVSESTRAWFTSRLSSKQNIFTSGTLTIKCDESICAGMAELDNIYPGWRSSGNVKIQNSGTIDLQYRMYMDTAGLEGNPLYDGEHPINISIIRGDSMLKDYTRLSNFGVLNMGSIPKGEFDNFTVAMKLPEDADNSCQGKSIDLKFIFEAKQEDAGSAYPGEVLVSSITITSGSGTFFVSPGNPLKLFAHMEPENASNKSIHWSVIPVTGNALVDQSGNVEAAANGSVKVRASAVDSSKIFNEVDVEVIGFTSASDLDTLKAAMQNPDVKAIDAASMVYNIEGGVLRNSGAQNVTINCSRGEAIVNIIKKDGTAYGILPQNIKAGAGVTINENVILAKKYSYTQAIIDSAPANSVIAFEGGLFYGGANINKPLTLLGIQSCLRGFEYSEGKVSYNRPYSSSIKGNIKITGAGRVNTVIRGFDFTGKEGMPIIVSGDCSNIKIVNNVFEIFPNGIISISGGNCNHVTIQGNAIKGWTEDNIAALDIHGSKNNDINISNNYIYQGNSLIHNSTGIAIAGGYNLQVDDNIIQNTNKAGILISGAGDTIECRRNIINNASRGIQFAYGVSPGISNINISDNIISQPSYMGIMIMKESEIAPGAVKDLSIYGNTISRNIYFKIAGENYRSICIGLSKDAEQHGKINILDNKFEIFGTANSAVDDTCCLMLSGRLNTVNITGNIFADKSNCPTPENIVGIHIVKNDDVYGPIPENAAITDNLSGCNNFDIFNGTDIIDERKPTS